MPITFPYANQVLLGDCLQIMPQWPEHSIDMVLCDLPYGTTQNTWDIPINLQELWAAYAKVVKPHGAILLFGQGIFTAKLILSNQGIFRYKIVWIKSKATNFLNKAKQPLRKHEDICVFYLQQPTFNPQMGRGKIYKTKRNGSSQGTYGKYDAFTSESNGGRYPTDVLLYEPADFIYCQTCEHTLEDYFHHAQKPIELARYLIRMYSNPGDLILDNTCGSGSFLVAAAIENRRYIGIELNQIISRNGKEVNLIDTCRKRLSSLQSSLEL
ncbi:DNA-methyltransferase [Chitinophaga sp. NPDC101104]|uniref:DNA-methyltransferase n=1 Tax=Chitinophaga sp. NPDC101104 TaxID=3390561 RepID=UPI003D02C679